MSATLSFKVSSGVRAIEIKLHNLRNYIVSENGKNMEYLNII